MAQEDINMKVKTKTKLSFKKYIKANKEKLNAYIKQLSSENSGVPNQPQNT